MLLLFLFSGLFASSPGFFDHFYGSWQNERISLSYFPNVYLGTHRNGVGINGDLAAWLQFGSPGSGVGVAAKADINGTVYLSDFGLPGSSLLLETGGMVMIGWGNASEFGESKWLDPGPYRHTLAKRYTYYFASDGTSQPFAQYIYALNIANTMIMVNFGNDAYAVTRDGFRSAAGEIELYINKPDHLLGVTLGYKIWHGDYSEQIFIDPGPYYDFSSIVGGDYTLGLLFASFRYNAFEISIGYDSDEIRVLLQNAVHRAMNINLVPDVERADRVFIELSLFGNSGLY